MAAFAVEGLGGGPAYCCTGVPLTITVAVGSSAACTVLAGLGAGEVGQSIHVGRVADFQSGVVGDGLGVALNAAEVDAEDSGIVRVLTMLAGNNLVGAATTVAAFATEGITPLCVSYTGNEAVTAVATDIGAGFGCSDVGEGLAITGIHTGRSIAHTLICMVRNSPA